MIERVEGMKQLGEEDVRPVVSVVNERSFTIEDT